MLLKEIKAVAEKKGVNIKKLRTKSDVVHAIQDVEGNQQCYGTNSSCDNSVCSWYDDCLKSAHDMENPEKRKKKKAKK